MAKFDMYEHSYENPVLSDEEVEREARIKEVRTEVLGVIAKLEDFVNEYEDILDNGSAEDVCEAIQYLEDVERRMRLR